MLHFEYIDTGGIGWNSLTIIGLFADGAEHGAEGSTCPSPSVYSYPYPSTTKPGARELCMTYRGDISRTV